MIREWQRCPFCHKTVLVRRDGKLWGHRRGNSGYECLGSSPWRDAMWAEGLG